MFVIVAHQWLCLKHVRIDRAARRAPGYRLISVQRKLLTMYWRRQYFTLNDCTTVSQGIIEYCGDTDRQQQKNNFLIKNLELY